jgi:hypothetical protein
VWLVVLLLVVALVLVIALTGVISSLLNPNGWA